MISVHWNVGRVCVSKGQLVVPLRVQRGRGQRCSSTFPLGDLRLGLAGSQDVQECTEGIDLFMRQPSACVAVTSLICNTISTLETLCEACSVVY